MKKPLPQELWLYRVARNDGVKYCVNQASSREELDTWLAAYAEDGVEVEVVHYVRAPDPAPLDPCEAPPGYAPGCTQVPTDLDGGKAAP